MASVEWGNYGRIVIIKRSGKDGPKFPLMDAVCKFGRHSDCDIRIQLPNISQFHTELCTDTKSKVGVHVWGSTSCTQSGVPSRLHWACSI